MYFYSTYNSSLHGVLTLIYRRISDNAVESFYLTDDNPNTAAYDAWVAEGNTAEEWSPDAS